MKTKELFDESRERWGVTSQMLMLVEELNELSVATLHLLRKNKNAKMSLENFAEEIADVEFMLEEMEYYFKNKDLILAYRNKKERQLEDLMHGLLRKPKK